MSEQSLSTNLPILSQEKDVKAIVEFAEKQGIKAHEQMIDTVIRSGICDVRVAKVNGVIVAMRVFQRVVNPIRGTMGYALLEDWSNGFVGLEPDS